MKKRDNGLEKRIRGAEHFMRTTFTKKKKTHEGRAEHTMMKPAVRKGFFSDVRSFLLGKLY